MGSHDQRQLTLEPRLLYLYVPYRNQDKLPLFDTACRTWIRSSCSAPTAMSAPIGSAMPTRSASVSPAGCSTALNGRQFLSATFGQIYYFSNPRVLLPRCRIDGRSRRPRRPHGQPLGFRRPARAHRLPRTGVPTSGCSGIRRPRRASAPQVNIQYKPGGTVPSSISATATSATCSTQAEISGAWPISAGLERLRPRGIYSFKDHKPLERFAGFEYRACCWKVRLGGRSFVSTRTGAERHRGVSATGTHGLASVGSASDSS